MLTFNAPILMTSFDIVLSIKGIELYDVSNVEWCFVHFVLQWGGNAPLTTLLVCNSINLISCHPFLMPDVEIRQEANRKTCIVVIANATMDSVIRVDRVLLYSF